MKHYQMRTFQDFLKAVNEGYVKDFILNTITDYQSSDTFRNARLGDEYMRQLNTTITMYRKWLYDLEGNAVPDNFSPNYRCASSYYKQNITQLVQYLLSNGVTFENDATKDKLGGSDFDNKITRIVMYAASEGVAYGFFNNGSVEWFRAREFVPLFDEENGMLRAGIRYWKMGVKYPLRVTLYTEDGYQDFIKRDSENLEEMHEMRAYIHSMTYVEGYDDTAILEKENYPTFPVVPCYANYERQAEIIGKQAHIDCYDLIESGYANNIDEASSIFWILNNAGGMDDVDIAEFKRRLMALHVVKTDDDSTAVPHSMDIPNEARETLLNRLERDIYSDAMALDPRDIAAGNVTATAIRAAYQRLDNRTDELEYCVIEFIQGLLKLAGVEDMPTFKRNRLTNQEEETQMVLNIVAAGLMDEQTALELIPCVTPEMVQNIMDRKAAEDMDRYEEVGTGNGSTETSSTEDNADENT